MAKIKSLTGKKKLMYEALMGQLGVVAAAAKQTGIDRTTHYVWMKEDENYKFWVEDLPEVTKDFAENALFTQIKKGNITGIIFFLKTRAKDRGYGEKIETENKTKLEITNDTSMSKEEIMSIVKRLLER